MIDKLQKFKAEFAREFAAHRYDITPTGLYFHRAGAILGGVFSTRVDGGPRSVNNNVVVYEGLDRFLNVFFNSAAQITAFYVVPFTNNVDPTQSLTAATFTATQGEFTNYTEATRPAWTSNGDSTAQSVSNSSSPARCTIGSGGGTVRGAGLITAQAKSATTGLLVAAARFDADSVLNAGSKLDMEYAMTASDA